MATLPVLNKINKGVIDMGTIIVRTDVEIDVDDINLDEIMEYIPTVMLKNELAARGAKEFRDISDDPLKVLEAISDILKVRPEDKRNKGKIVAAIIEL
jgi:hypothetical protein